MLTKLNFLISTISSKNQINRNSSLIISFYQKHLAIHYSDDFHPCQILKNMWDYRYERLAFNEINSLQI